MQVSCTERNAISLVSGGLVSISIRSLVPGKPFLPWSSLVPTEVPPDPACIEVPSSLAALWLRTAFGAQGSLGNLGIPVSGRQWSPSQNLPLSWCCLGHSDCNLLQESLISLLCLKDTPLSPLYNLKAWGFSKTKARRSKCGAEQPCSLVPPRLSAPQSDFTHWFLSDSSRGSCLSSCTREGPVDAARPNHELDCSVAEKEAILGGHLPWKQTLWLKFNTLQGS